MNVKTFIDRPILAGVISIVVVLAGIIGLGTLPLEQYPDIAPPTIQVSASYTGANAETIVKSVISPLEESINGVENMTYMTSNATNTGEATITVYFKQGTNADMATVNVQNRVAKAQGLLPAEVTKIGVTTRKRQNSTLKIFSIYSPDDSYDKVFISNYLKINVQPQIQRVTGVGDVMILGGDYSMRIWLKPDVMAQYNLVPSDINAVLAEQNIEAPTGTLGENSDNTFQYTLKYRGRHETPEEFNNLVVRALPNGEILRLGDVAKVELGAITYGIESETNGHPGASCMISQTAGSNANQIITDIDEVLKKVEKELPKGLAIAEIMSTKDFLDASISNVLQTLIEAIILVILVVYVFLQNFRATLIPSVAIIVSLIGTFAFLAIAGFSLNLLTLFALVLVIGTVVDDAIVVVEAVQAKFDVGYKSPYLATVDAMGDITSAIVTTSLVFMSVFIPVCFMGGTAGTFYTQFGITMAVAVAISTVNALTLSPALCAIILTPHQDATAGGKLSFSSRFRLAFEASFSRIIAKYKKGVEFFLRRKWLTAVLLVGSFAALFFLIKTTKTGLVPDEDTGVIFTSVTATPGNTLAQTEEVMKEVENAVKDIPQIASYSKVTGYSMMSGQGASGGMMFLKLKPWDERKGKENSVAAITGQIYQNTSHIKAARIFAFAPPMITGYGMTNGFELYVQDKKGGDVNDLFAITQQFLGELNQRPEISRAYTSFNVNFPQYVVDVDAARCKRANVSPGEVLSSLSGYVGGAYSSNVNRFSKLYRVMVQASPEYRLDKESLNNIFVRTSTGEMAPIGQFLTLTKVYGSESLSNFNMFNSISVNGMAADGYSSGDAVKAIEEVAATVLPAGYGYEYGGMTREEAKGGSSTVLIFGICIVLIFLLLCALYESFFIPMAVILSVPFGLAGSFLFAKMFGLENNIYMQTGLLMLIGLLSKTAILMTEYASERRRKGMSIVQAALSAATVRLRPILMTALTMVFGLLPLMFATGVGANGNMSLGVGTVGGMLIGTLALLFIVPVLFIVLQKAQEKYMPERKETDIYSGE
ncbi:MAG: efflux RND transporter permease subunit [Rikenellaceae bacterium]